MSWPAAASLVGLVACGDGSDSDGVRPPTPVEAVVAVRDTVTVTVRAVGTFEADAQVELRAEAEGRITDLLMVEGQEVGAGEPLLRIDREKLLAETGAAEAALHRARVEEENLRRQVERNRGLLADGAISQQAYDDLETLWKSAEARMREATAALALARERLAEATVRAPFAGRVGERLVDPGDFVKRGDPLVTVVNDDTLELGFAVPERYVGRLGTGRPVSVTVQSYPDRQFAGTVTFVSPLVDPENRVVRVKARVPNPERVLLAGQFANVELDLEERPDAVVVPEEAIVPRAGEAFVFLVRGGVARRQEVTIGARSRGSVEMLAGVQAGDTVVVAGQQKLGDGSPVAPRIRPLRLETEPAGGALGGASGTAVASPPGSTIAPPRPDRKAGDRVREGRPAGGTGAGTGGS